ncbi:hypothetical protein GC207_15435 [bacterium]|nr:hypothetical protein [bacterium]
MKILKPSRHKRSAFATAAVVILLIAASAVTLTVVAVFRNLHHELRFTEMKQQQHWTKVVINSASTTNALDDRRITQSPDIVAKSAQP